MKRRDFLKNSIFTAGAFAGSSLYRPSAAEGYAFSIVKEMISKAQAESVGALGQTRNYVGVLLGGAPARWVFDQWVRTNPSDPNVNVSGMAHTKLTFGAGGLTGSEPGYFQHRELLVPHLFSTSAMTSSGNRPLTELLDNMAVIRGYGTGIDGHPLNAVRQLVPVGGLPSITGAVADGGDHLFSGVAYPPRSDFGQFISQRGQALNILSLNPPLHQLMRGFAPPPAQFGLARSAKEKYQDIYDRAMSALKVYAESDSPGNRIVAQNLEKARTLIKRGISDLDGFWNPTLEKYQNAFRINARAIGLPGISSGPMLYQPGFGPRMNVDFRLVGPVFQPHPAFDLRQAIEIMDTNYLSEGFALTEYLLRERLCSAIELFDINMKDVRLRGLNDAAPVTNRVEYDMHDWGAYSTLLFSAGLFRGISGLILELKSALQRASARPGQSLWDETVVHVFGDFGRSARTASSGSDHGFHSMVSSLFSGCIREPMVVGNISNGGLTPDYAGAYGVGVPISDYNMPGLPTPALMTSSLAEVLRLPVNPWRNVAEPLLINQSDRIVYSSFGKGKIVGGGNFG